ncbi:MAG TPA: DUF1127 domain-containing protein [Pseudolabrys sp.]|nr:DUF1127 domain-containing protein [Pseudolabrys sp.]
MINVVFQLYSAASHYSPLLHGACRALDELPDAVLKDIGITRSDIPFGAGELVFKHRNPPCNAIDRFDWNAVWRNATILRLPETVLRLALVTAATVCAAFVLSFSILA